MTRGVFISFEGGEGAGKSTQARALADRLRAEGKSVLLTREPGGSPGAEEIRHLLVTGEPGRWTPETETLLHFAARADHLARTVRPALARGDWVLCDRFVDSTTAYQGYGQGIGLPDIDWLTRFIVGDDGPDLTFILDVPVEMGLSRAAARTGDENRYERMDRTFHERLRAAFQDIARQNPARCLVLDATRPPAQTGMIIWDAVRSHLLP
ncbi:MAG: dTMP kinase [Parvibaculaceae bacterium]|nr:dTMP kinase [Parvibaculaceae bacterium]